jgi:hypothetical protein
MRSTHRLVPALVLILAALAAPVAADAATGSATFKLGKQGASALGKSGIRLGAYGSARASGRRVAVKLPAASVKGGKRPVVAVRGGLRLRRGTRVVKLASLRLKVARGRLTVSARLGARRITALSGRLDPGALDPDLPGVHLSSTKVALTAGARRALARRLRAPLPRGAIGTVRIGALPTAKKPAATTPPGSAPAPAPRPPTATAVTAATLTWNVRDSFVRYINTGEGTSVSGGAIADPPTVRPGSDAALVYSFRFPFASGWYDSATGTAALKHTGAVRFRYSAHTIDLTTADPEVELAGAASRAVVRFDGPTAGDLAGQRGVLMDLDPAGATRTVGNGGKTITYTTIPGKVPQGTAGSVFAGFYMPGDEFGSMTVSFTTP